MFLRLIVTAGIVYLIYRLVRGFFLTSARPPDKFPEGVTPIEKEDLVMDPYCNTYVPVSDAYKASINGKTVYFCSEECFNKYKAEGKSSDQ
jgi:uncharacterized protein